MALQIGTFIRNTNIVYIALIVVATAVILLDFIWTLIINYVFYILAIGGD